ncbi:NAD(P)-binding domain-containing protein [Flavobacterium sp. MC2016-06]|jgi:predicted dinucleotide-binding enzyme|uniref:NADPH-dependent F420 reductase n=1 Tax=Flavobacterium sp. MC2016-06 TaxID=2676308 RepID=UPI0012BB108A|nr:NAD(P)-binding domain-containing protein [Flavobacterium sp. MC2016-06]MBU3857700.1 NAD(P)-binding domain-containing protein [Flavobacterium sp. MC2016-06]
MKNSSQTKVAIIGLGNIGLAIATDLTKGNHNVILASREFEKAKTIANNLGVTATAKTITEAIEEADIIIPSIGFNLIKDFLKEYKNELSGKMIIDVSNPIAPDGNGGFKKIIAENESAAKILSELLPPDAKLVKAFGTLGAESLKSDAFKTPFKMTLFYASDNTNNNSQIEELISSAGFEPLHIGGIDQSIRIEVFGDLHQFGALGKTISLEEAKAAIAKS